MLTEITLAKVFETGLLYLMNGNYLERAVEKLIGVSWNKMH